MSREWDYAMLQSFARRIVAIIIAWQLDECSDETALRNIESEVMDKVPDEWIRGRQLEK